MRFKLDENLGRAEAMMLREAGFDVLTVSDQQLEGTVDQDLIEHCSREGRCLVTLDAEFGNPFVYPPDRYHGIVLLRVPGRMTRDAILDTVRTLRDAVVTRDHPAGGSVPLPGPDRRLWVVQPGRVRLYQGAEQDDV